MIYEMASGLLFMHTKGFAHRDYKPLNVLIEVDDNNPNNEMSLKPILADFGLSAVLDKSMIKVKAYRESKLMGGSLHYLSPDFLRQMQSGQFEEVVPNDVLLGNDVYAFAICAYQVLTRDSAWANYNAAQWIDYVLSGGRPVFPEWVRSLSERDIKMNVLVTMIESCWSQDYKRRLKMSQVQQKLKGIFY